MSYTSDYVLNEENIASFLKDAVEKVESANDSDIKALEQIKKLFHNTIYFKVQHFRKKIPAIFTDHRNELKLKNMNLKL